MKKKKGKSSNNTIILVLLVLVFGVILANQSVAVQLLLFFIVFGALALKIFLKFYPKFAQKNRLRNLDLENVDQMPGKAFEHYVAELMSYRGFQTEVTRSSGDLGIDIVAQNGNTRYAVQCKRYGSNISRTAVSDAVAGKNHYKCQIAVVVTNQYFRKGAQELARSNKCILIDRDQLAEWVTDYREKRPIHKLLK